MIDKSSVILVRMSENTCWWTLDCYELWDK